MKFEGADSPKVVTVSTVLLLGAIAGLIIWALQAAYALN
ncbi:RNA polymerase subunit sigma [Trichormus variabilis ARAD]|nr:MULTISPECIES: RNA polymerase subunit sigma [Nostocaceae]MBC1303928.1 RNA polymerase subunit sigma [Trichormus variabilis N2B]MBC1310389.1 RNA polymerase subunit sigma [Trichormus variabilis PNB]MBC1325023.1 RNA polymerase subunit sigma [Trichormus variabilis 9RC]MBD2250260.1 RNA polymerase subunit sigma [Nostoc parmelioides FACHB-3921]MBD2261802.1 RNA polymerase subunit sigma [Anabaena sp. FACHB-709]MBD2282344.1 RNA polymerase subunit sigma [Anabaena cylindrica FACHB-170]MBD2348456.1 RNA 